MSLCFAMPFSSSPLTDNKTLYQARCFDDPYLTLLHHLGKIYRDPVSVASSTHKERRAFLPEGGEGEWRYLFHLN